MVYPHQIKEVVKNIESLELSIGKDDFDEKFLGFFADACNFLKISDHSKNAILDNEDPYLIDSIIWKYLYSFGLNMEMRKYKCFEIDNKTEQKRRGSISLWVEPIESFGNINFLPSSEVILPLSVYTFIEHQPYLLTLTKENHLAHEEDNFYSEQKWADKETAILISLINLSLEYGFCTFFTGDNGFYLPISVYIDEVSELNADVISLIKEKVKLYEFVAMKTQHETPVVRKDFGYKQNLNLKKINTLNQAVDRKNAVLVRCLYNFAKACAYAPHKMMMEESTALQMFCLDGLAKLFMEKYNIEKIADLDEFLKRKFSCPYGEYLNELYDERTIYVHPANIHGEYWCPPWDADTCLDTLPVVRDMLCLYLTEEFHFSDSRWEHSIEEMENGTK